MKNIEEILREYGLEKVEDSTSIRGWRVLSSTTVSPEKDNREKESLSLGLLFGIAPGVTVYRALDTRWICEFKFAVVEMNNANSVNTLIMADDDCPEYYFLESDDIEEAVNATVKCRVDSLLGDFRRHNGNLYSRIPEFDDGLQPLSINWVTKSGPDYSTWTTTGTDVSIDTSSISRVCGYTQGTTTAANATKNITANSSKITCDDSNNILGSSRLSDVLGRYDTSTTAVDWKKYATDKIMKSC